MHFKSMRKGQVIPMVADRQHGDCTSPRTLTAYITNSVACFLAEPRYGFGIFPHMACQPASSIYQCTQDYLTSNAVTISYLFEKIKLNLYCTPYAKINSTQMKEFKVKNETIKGLEQSCCKGILRERQKSFETRRHERVRELQSPAPPGS